MFGKSKPLPGSERDEVVPEGKWEFDAEVTRSFEDMLERSIPQYDVMRKAVTDAAAHFAQRQTSIVDLGCSRGEALARVAQELGMGWHNFVGVEVSEPMRKAAEARFSDTGNYAVVFDTDLRYDFPPLSPLPSVILCVLTLQFIPIEHRQRLLWNCYRSLVPGGAMILVEKVLGATHPINEYMTDSYLDLKAENGYTEEQIARKKLSLEGVLVPVTAEMNEEMLDAAGFRQVDCLWRWMNFAAWVAIKE